MILRCYNRYFIRSLFGPFFLIALTLTGIIWLTQSLRFIDLIVNRGLGIQSFLYLSLLLVPFLLSIALPVALFCAVTFVYYKFIMDSEIIVLKSVGLSRPALAKPALIVAGMTTLFAYALSLYVTPRSYREFRDLQVFIRDNYASVLLQEGVFNTPIKGFTVYIESRDEKGMLRGLLVHDARDPKKPVTMMAEQGKLVQTPSGPRFDLRNGNRQEINPKTGQLSLLYFDRYIVDLGGMTKVTEPRRRDPRERYLSELFNPNSEDKADVARLRTEGHQRLTWPFYNLALACVALAALLSGQFNRRGKWRRIWVSTVCAALLIIFGVAQASIMVKVPAMTPAMYVVPLLTVVLSLYTMQRRPKPCRRSMEEPSAVEQDQ